MLSVRNITFWAEADVLRKTLFFNFQTCESNNEILMKVLCVKCLAYAHVYIVKMGTNSNAHSSHRFERNRLIRKIMTNPQKRKEYCNLLKP